MGLSMDFSNVGNADKVNSGGGDRPSPGKGMVLITKFEEYGAQNGAAHLLEFEVVAWTDKESVGKSHNAHIRHQDKTGKGHPWKCMTALGIAGGLFTGADVSAWQAAGTMPDVDFESLGGRPIMLQLSEEPDRDDPNKKWLRVPYGTAYFHLQDPRVKDWPRNQGIFNANAGKVGEFKPAGGEKTTSPEPANPFAAANA